MDLNKWEADIVKKLQNSEVVYLRAKIIPGSSKNEFVEILDDEESTIKIRIAAAPEKGKANKEIIKFLEKYFACKCEIISGGTTSVKLLKLNV